MGDFMPMPGGKAQTVLNVLRLSKLLDAAFGANPGTILYRGATRWLGLADGLSGQLLQSLSSGGNPPLAWATPNSTAPITNSLAANVTLSGSNAFNNGPTVAQGGTGKWFASGTCTVINTNAADTITGKLWDGTTVIASCRVTTPGANFAFALSLSGFIASPAGNLRIDIAGGNANGGLILANNSGLGKDSTITAFRLDIP